MERSSQPFAVGGISAHYDLLVDCLIMLPSVMLVLHRFCQLIQLSAYATQMWCIKKIPSKSALTEDTGKKIHYRNKELLRYFIVGWSGDIIEPGWVDKNVFN